jgi:disulfide bond formation protein DsbB
MAMAQKMQISPKTYIAAATAGSGALLAGAFAFEHIGGLLPCTLCIWQRWPHGAALAIGALALALPKSAITRALPLLGALAVLCSAAIAGFHVGVEQGWWEGLASCTVNAMAGVSVEDLLSLDTNVAAPVACDAIAWQMFGLSMAGWNGVISVLLAAVWLQGARQYR